MGTLEAKLTKEREGTAVVMVRMDPSLHVRLKDTAKRQKLSMNKLCIEVLMDAVEALEED